MKSPWSGSHGAWTRLLLLWGVAGPLAASAFDLINVQFGTDGSARKVGPAAVGLTQDDYWNLYSRDVPGGGYKSLGDLTDLKWSNGEASGASLTLANAPGAWGNGYADPMFGIYLYCFDGQPLTLTIDHLPEGTYDVLAYGHGGPPNVQNTAFELKSAGKVVGTGRTSSRADWKDTTWAAGVHYVEFTQVSVFTNFPLVLTSLPDASAVALINGLQLVRRSPVPIGTPPTNSVPPIDPPLPTNSIPTGPSTNNQPVGLLNLDFGTDGSGIRRGPAAIGQAADDYWNRYSRDDGHGGFRYFGALETLYWANGTSSGAKVEVYNAAGAWPNGVDDPMFGIFLYPLTSDPNVRVVFRQLPPGLYSAVVYARGGPPDDHNTTIEILADDISYGDRTTATSGWNSTDWQEGRQYVRYSHIVVGPETALTVLAKPAAHPFGMINGLQLELEHSLGLQALPSGGLFTNEVAVQLLGAIPPQQVRYTLDGTAPSTNAALYHLPVVLRAAAQLRAQIFSGVEPVGEPVSISFQRVYALDDGISKEWRRQHFGEGFLTDPRVAADADPDGDGASNFQEFATGSDPLDPLSGFLVRTRLVPSVTWKSEPGTRYRILRKDHLSDAEWRPVTEVLATDPLSRFIDADVPNADSFYLVEPIR